MRIASLGTASVDQRTTQSDEKHNIHFKQKTAALTLSTLYFSIKFSCSMLLYVVCSCIALYRCHSLPAQPCGWCAIRTLRVGRHHPRRLDLSLSLDTPSRHSLSHTTTTTTSSSSPSSSSSSPQNYFSPLSIPLPGASAFD